MKTLSIYETSEQLVMPGVPHGFKLPQDRGIKRVVIKSFLMSIIHAAYKVISIDTMIEYISHNVASGVVERV